MTKTIFVPDLHLKAQLILPIFEELIQSRDIKNVVFMGDYTDAHGQKDNLVLYVNDLLYLTNFVQKLKDDGIDVTMFIIFRKFLRLIIITRRILWDSLIFKDFFMICSCNQPI